MSSRVVGGGNLLIKAVKDGDIDECRWLLELKNKGEGGKEGVGDSYAVVDINEKDITYGWSPIILASWNGHVDIAELLLSEGANIHDKDNDDNSPIIRASQNGHVDTVELLLSKGANIHDKDNYGFSPIILASWNGHVDIVQLLLSRGANIHDRNNHGFSPIIKASGRDHVDVVQLLLSKGANVYDTTNLGNSGLSMTSNDQIKSALLKWHTTMGIIMLQELGIIFIIDSESVIDLNQYING